MGVTSKGQEFLRRKLMPPTGFVNATLKSEPYRELKELSWKLSAHTHKWHSISGALAFAVKAANAEIKRQEIEQAEETQS
jgi:hypothetical protein